MSFADSSTFSLKRGIPDRTLWPAVGLLAAAVILFEVTPLDLRVQDFFYNFSSHKWIVNVHSRMPRLFFYTGPRVLFAALAAGLLVLVSGPARWRRLKRGGAALRRRDLWVVLATMASVPALAGMGKAVTNMFCPSEVQRYGGRVPYVSLWESFPAANRPACRGRCFPAGHASGGFALLSLAGLAAGARGRLAGILIGLMSGGITEAYQMLKGAHYLSHTLVTALGAWIIFLLWRRVILPENLRT